MEDDDILDGCEYEEEDEDILREVPKTKEEQRRRRTAHRRIVEVARRLLDGNSDNTA